MGDDIRSGRRSIGRRAYVRGSTEEEWVGRGLTCSSHDGTSLEWSGIRSQNWIFSEANYHMIRDL